MRPSLKFALLPASKSCWKTFQTKSRPWNESKNSRRLSEVPEIGICYDTGHGHIQGVTPPLRTFAPHTFTTITAKKTNICGRSMEHWTGRLSIEKLVLANYKGPLMFEARGEELSKGHEVMSRLEDLWARGTELD